MIRIIVRNGVEEDIPAIADIYRGAAAAAGTLQNPFVSADVWTKRQSSMSEGAYSLVAMLDKELVGAHRVYRSAEG